MPAARFDHVSIPAADAEGMIAFYRSLGFAILGEDEFRGGGRPIFSIAFGDSKINVHGPDFWPRPEFTLRGPSAAPGCGDFCFVWEGGLADLRAALEAAEAAIEEGPVPRQGGRGGGQDWGVSVYVRDPDRNLLEFIVYDDGGGRA